MFLSIDSYPVELNEQSQVVFYHLQVQVVLQSTDKTEEQWMGVES